MVWSKDQWVGNKPMFDQPSFRQGELTGSRNGEYTGAMVFTPAESGKYAWFGTMGFSSSHGNVHIAFVQFDGSKGRILYDGWFGAGTTLEVNTIPALQSITVDKGGRIALLVTGEDSQFGKALLDRCEIRALPVLHLSTEPQDFSRRNTTPSRDQICLNGRWDWQIASGMLYNPFSNPDLFPKSDSPLPIPNTNIRPESPEWNTALIPNHPPHPYNCKWAKNWYRRSVYVPKEWQGRRVELTFMGAGFEVIAFVNGQCAGSHLGDVTGFAIDITDQVKFGQDNEVLLSVWWHGAIFGEVWPQGLIETIWSRRTGVWDDVYLTSRPKTSVDYVFCKPSVRDEKLAVDIAITNTSDLPAKLKVENVVLDGEGREVLKFDPTLITATPKKETITTLEKYWPDPRLWWPHDPYLYYLETRLIQDGKTVDVHRERFGFREMWIKGRDFYVNGKIHHFHCITHDPGSGIPWDQNPAWIRAMLRRYKDAGYTMVRTFAKPSYIFMEAADEVGIYLKVQSGWHHANNPLTDEFKKNAGQTVKDWIVRDRNHPSIIMWDAANEPNGQYESVYWVMNEIRKHDPTRPVDVDRSYGVTIYNGDGVPKTIDNYNVEHKQYGLDQFEIANPHYPIICGLSSFSLLTAAEYPARWMTLGKIPLFFGEWGDFGSPGRTTRGPDHYADMFTLREQVWGQGFEFTTEGWLTFLEEIMPHWRRYKVSGYDEWLSHTTLSWMNPPMEKENFPVDPNQPFIDVVWDRLDTPGLKFESVNYLEARVNPGWIAGLPEWPMDEHWKRYSQLWKPRFAFFHDKTRAIYGGRNFSRSLTLINDTLDEAVMEGTATLTVEGKEPMVVSFATKVRQGSVKDIPIRFDLPDVKQRTPARVTITLQGSQDDLNTVPLELDLFPSMKQKTPTKRIVLYDPTGKTVRVFTKQGIKFRRTKNPNQIDSSTEVLVLGENSLDDNVLAAAGSITQFVEKGGRVVCLAQNEWKDYLPVKIRQNRDIDTSLTYILSASHPLFDGLESHDFCWWPNNRNQKFKIPGAVADKPFYKPLTGPARSLLECGFNLDLSALLEVRHGDGEYYLSQLKLIDILGESPVADRVLDRLLYADRSNTKYGSAENRTVWFAGGALSRAMLTDRLGVLVTDLSDAGKHEFTSNDLIVWIPNVQSIAPAVRDIASRAIKQGAALLAVAGDAKELPPLDAPPVYGEALQYAGQVYVLQTSKPDGWNAPEGRFIKIALVDRAESIVDGVSNAEMNRSHHRHGTFKLGDYEIEPKNGWRPVTKPGVIAVRDGGNVQGPQVIVTAIRNGPTGELTKYEQMIHSLLLNLGGIHQGQFKPKIIPSADSLGAFFNVDLRSYCNMGFADEVAGDGKGGWGDQGPQNDLRSFPVGQQKFLDIPFDIIDPKTNDGKSCIVLGSDQLKALPRTIKGIDFGHRKARRIYFLHSMTWAPTEGTMGEYRIHYGKALDMKQTIVLESGKNIGDWWRPTDLEDARVAWRGGNAFSTVGVYLYVWENPHPDTVIDEIDFTGVDKNAIMHLIAITGQE